MAVISGWVSRSYTDDTPSHEMPETTDSMRHKAKFNMKGGNMEIPDTHFIEMAKKSPIVILGDRVFVAKDRYDGEKNYLNSGEEKYGLVECDTTRGMEMLYHDINKDAIFEVKKEFSKISLRKKLHSYESVIENLKSAESMIFILNEVIPKLVPENPEELLGEARRERPIEKFMRDFPATSNQSEKMPVFESLKSGLEELEKNSKYIKRNSSFSRLYRTIASTDEMDVLLDDSQQRNGFAAIGGMVYRLQSGKGAIGAKIGKEYQIAQPIGTIDWFDNEYRKVLVEDFSVEADEEATNQQEALKDIEAEYSKMIESVAAFEQKGKFEYEGTGILRRNGANFIYIKIPEFALKDSKKDTGSYLFNGCRIGVKVSYGDSISVGKPVVIEQYSHPFLKHYNDEFQEICMGDYNTTVLSNMNSADAITKYLADAATIISRGYTATCRPYNHLDNSYFTGQRVGDLELTRRKIKAMN
ncbi:MAG: hypothetical protein HZB68_01095 [Candidatus Aenigmarchaeota archaeon]|nr:hypothetical protein [Candidatus Aenigmarchaeota archaeon]